MALFFQECSFKHALIHSLAHIAIKITSPIKTVSQAVDSCGARWINTRFSPKTKMQAMILSHIIVAAN